MSLLEGSDHRKSLPRSELSAALGISFPSHPRPAFQVHKSLAAAASGPGWPLWWTFRNLMLQGSLPLCEHPIALNGSSFAWRRSPPHTGTCAYSFNHTVNSLLFFFKLKIYRKHYSIWYAHSSKHNYPFRHFRVFHVEALRLDSPSTVNGCIPCFLTFFHSIFVHLAFPSYWMISSGEIHISEIPGSFVLIWFLVHVVRWPYKTSVPVQAATPQLVLHFC